MFYKTIYRNQDPNISGDFMPHSTTTALKELIKKKLHQSVPLSNGNGVFLLEEWKSISKEYLDDTPVEDRCMLLLLSLHLSDNASGVAYEPPHKSFIKQKWIPYAVKWLLHHKIDITLDNIQLLLQSVFNIIKDSTKYEEVTINFDRHVAVLVNENYPKDTPTLALSPEFFYARQIVNNSSHVISHKDWLSKNCIDTDTERYAELYFWVRLESLLGLRLIFNRGYNTQDIWKVLKYQENSYVTELAEFCTQYCNIQLRYQADFFKFIDENMTSYHITEEVEGFFACTCFMTTSEQNGHWFWNADFKLFLSSLKERNPTAYENFIKYEEAAITLAYALNDHFMYRKPLSTNREASAWWESERAHIEFYPNLSSLFINQHHCPAPPFLRSTIAGMVHNLRGKSPSYHAFHRISEQNKGNVVLDARAYILKRCQLNPA
ncbi:MAG: hypothetical protein KDI39_03955 [Pseudomonadales bacterium]|nr:hypothetical protein [Pseudomonadales bacterium]